jgi:hypothetical protein
MIDTRIYACAVCGEANADPAQWFLITENHWEDKLRILEWNPRLASEQGIHLACSPSHVQELVVHWMATGSVHHPFAQTTNYKTSAQPWNDSAQLRPILNTKGTRTISELTVHRESMYRALSESPGSLKSILDALNGALHRCDSAA